MIDVFLAPVPILHVHAMFEDIEKGKTRFAFGSNALTFFDKHIKRITNNEDLPAYIYVTKNGQEHLSSSSEKKFGVLIKARLIGWEMATNRGLYPATGQAHRPHSTHDDTQVALFWEIDNVEKLSERIPITSFIGATSKPFSDNFVPEGPLKVKIR